MTLTKSPASRSSALKRIRFLTQVLDEAVPIPGTGRKVGLDPIIGVLTGGGDGVGMFMSAYILLESLRFGLPKATLIRMLSNVALDAIVGTIPFLGDIFDFVWGANSKNLRLLEAHLDNPGSHTPADRKFAFLILVGLVAILSCAIGIGLLIGGSVFSLVKALFGG